MLVQTLVLPFCQSYWYYIIVSLTLVRLGGKKTFFVQNILK